MDGLTLLHGELQRDGRDLTDMLISTAVPGTGPWPGAR